MRRFAGLFLALLLSSASLPASEKLVAVLEARPSAEAVCPAPVAFWQEVRKEPRPLHIYCLKADLSERDIEAAALITPAPGGPGPAEATLEKPAILASRQGVLAAVNSNAFAILPAADGVKSRSGPRGNPGAPVDICGWAKDGSREASPAQSGYASFWTDAGGRGHIGAAAAPGEARMAVSGFKELVRDGKSLSADLKPVHPRTAVGVDAEGKTLWLVVVDGRQAGYSEGMSLGELAALMKDLGCWNALNLDGGGSSSMLLAAQGEKAELVNRPSDSPPRPVPVMLGLQRRAKRNEE